MPALNRNNIRLHYELTGNGPPVLLIQGAGVAGSGWEPQVAGLRDDFRCLSFDNRGIGGSTIDSRSLTIAQMANDARALMDTLGWESAHVAGHSMGGLIAQDLAIGSPERVRSLSLLCTFAEGAEAARMTPKVVWLGLRTHLGTRAMRRRAFLEMLFTGEYIAAEGASKLAARVGPIVGRDLADTPSIMMRQLGAMRGHRGTGRLAALAQIPTLIVSAEKDPIALVKYGQGIARCIPGSRYVEISEASHGVTIQMPERINEMLRRQFTQAKAAG